MIKQVKFLDKENNDILGGIQLDNGDIICGCCGSLFKADDDSIEVIEVYPYWVDLSNEIKGE